MLYSKAKRRIVPFLFFVLYTFSVSIVSSFLFFFTRGFERIGLVVRRKGASSGITMCGGERVRTSFIFGGFSIRIISSVFGGCPLAGKVFSAIVSGSSRLIRCLKDGLQGFIFLSRAMSLPVGIRCGAPGALNGSQLTTTIKTGCLRPKGSLLIVSTKATVACRLVSTSNSCLKKGVSPKVAAQFETLGLFARGLPLIIRRRCVPLIKASARATVRTKMMGNVIYRVSKCVRVLQLGCPGLLIFLANNRSFCFREQLGGSVFTSVGLILAKLGEVLRCGIRSWWDAGGGHSCVRTITFSNTGRCGLTLCPFQM